MRSQNHSNALLVELMIIIAFFMLSATMLMQVFSAAKKQGDKADMLNRALTDAQNIAEVMYASDNSEEALAGMGFVCEDGIWIMAEDETIAMVTLEEEESGAGVMEKQYIRILKDDEELIALPGAKYREAER